MCLYFKLAGLLDFLDIADYAHQVLVLRCFLPEQGRSSHLTDLYGQHIVLDFQLAVLVLRLGFITLSGLDSSDLPHAFLIELVKLEQVDASENWLQIQLLHNLLLL